MDTQNKQILRSLAEVAWADGEVTEDERALLFSICLQFGATEEEMSDLKEVLGKPNGEPGDLNEVLPDKESRLNVMRSLLIMSFVDGALAFAEFDLLAKKADELEITRDEMETLRQEALSASESFRKQS